MTPFDTVDGNSDRISLADEHHEPVTGIPLQHGVVLVTTGITTAGYSEPLAAAHNEGVRRHGERNAASPLFITA